ncbi:MAG: CAP domain-containing protein [bacterium]
MKKTIIFLVILGGILYVYQAKILNIYNRRDEYVQSLIDIAKNNNSIDGELPNVVDSIRSSITPGALRVATKLHIASAVELSRDKVIELTNENRKDNGGLVALKENYKLDRSAEIKIKDMFHNQYFEHKSPSGVSVSDLGDKVSYEYIVIGENLAMGDFATDRELVDAWMASPGHRANILNNRYTEIGVAVARGTYDGRSIWMAVQHFGMPKSLCPTIEESLHSTITTDEDSLKVMSLDISKQKDQIDNGGLSGDSYNTAIDTFNSLVEVYNNLVIKVKDNVALYNSQVQAFNACVGETTHSGE